ncbi:MAG: 50S ribosomal protein L22 [Clostridia bacterium]|nr:50S ribosomal protein L22 [Clostridia bacterium]
MEIKASLNNLRMSPRKARLVLDIVRGLPVEKALEQLQFINKLAAEPILKLIKSAIANAEHNFNLVKDNLYIKEIKADGGMTIKRWMPRAHGRATTIRKRSCHITLVLGEIVASEKKEARKVKVEAPVKLEQIVAEAEKGAKQKKAITKKTKSVDDKLKIETKTGKGFTNKTFNRKAGSK